MLAIRAARLFDGLQLRERPLVLVAGDRIADIDFTGAQPPAGSEVVDFGDATLLPGLIDTHMHLVFDASADPPGHLEKVSDETLFGEVRSAAKQALDAGVTCVRDLGDRSYLGVRLRELTAGRPELGPDVVPAGPPITVPSGHCWFLGGTAKGPGAVRKAVRELARNGAAVIKVMVTGGLMTPGTMPGACQFSDEELRAAADEAHQQGLPITGHAHGREGIVAALAAGFDGVEHASFLTPSGPEPDSRVIEAMASAGTFVSTCVPGTVPGIPLPPLIAAIMDRVRTLIRALAEGGTRIVIGPDAGIAPHKPHSVLPYAIADMAQLMGNAEALAAATYHAAQACNVADRKGRLAPGFDADIVAIGGDPLTDISAIHRRIAVFHRGISPGQGTPPGRAGVASKTPA